MGLVDASAQFPFYSLFVLSSLSFPALSPTMVMVALKSRGSGGDGGGGIAGGGETEPVEVCGCSNLNQPAESRRRTQSTSRLNAGGGRSRRLTWRL